MRIESKEMFSVIMPAYRAQETIGRAIESVLSQTDTNLELIVINDCSTDQTSEIAKNFARQDSRVIVIDLPKNKGVAVARNVGIETARGDFIAFLDADDAWVSNKLEKQRPLLDQGNVIVCSDYYSVSGKKRKLITLPPGELTFSRLLIANFIGNLSGVYNLKALGRKFYQAPIGHEDYAMWLDIAQQGKIAGVRTPLAVKYNHPGSVASNKLCAAIWTWKIQGSHLSWRVDRRVIFFTVYIWTSLLKRL